MKAVRTGVIGCGAISPIYLQNGSVFEDYTIAACADKDLDRAKARAKEFGVPRVCSVDEILADPEIELSLNLTTPEVHGSIGRRALEAGKSVYNEKPLAATREEARNLLDLAGAKGLLVGAAPDTFLGGGLQTCRKLVDEGAIGEPVAATAFMLCPGHESWHPDPAFYYQVGGGPLFDMGPYYLTALVSLLGPVEQVTGSARITFAERTITSKPRAGARIRVETPTHIAGCLEFVNGAVATMTMSFDVWAHHLPRLELHGSEGSLSLPDPNTFGGPVSLWRKDNPEWTQIALSHGYADNMRGLGVADMAAAIRKGRPHRANGRMAYHVLDAMHAILDASRLSRHVQLVSACERPAPLPEELPAGRVELEV